jgi:Dolichyl-phosphate-mannose-protein mannosyltransferase
MTILVHQLLLAFSVLALLDTGVRLTSPALPLGLSRIVGATVLAAALAVTESLLVGALAGDLPAVGLATAAAVTWVAAIGVCPRPELSPVAEAAEWWRGSTTARRAAVGAAAGAFVGWAVWELQHPLLGHDMILYHLPLAMAFVQESPPGSIPDVAAILPVGTYPAVYETLSAWATGLSRSLTAFSLIPPALIGLAAVAMFAGLRELRVSPTVAVLAAANLVVAFPAWGWQQSGAPTDPAAMCWTACCGALCVATRRHPGAFPVALVAAGLAVGTKTTAVPVTAAFLAITVITLRDQLRPRLALWGGLALGGLVGLFWYTRNLVTYGSPVWPFISTPWGDPSPPGLADNPSFTDAVGTNFRWLARDHFSHFIGPVIALAAGVLAPVLAPRRLVVALSATTLLTMALWTQAPFTGAPGGVLPPPEFSLTTVRYLLPALVAGVAALALSARAERWRETAVTAVLGLSAAIAVLQAQTEPELPVVVPLWAVAAGAGVGAVGAVAVARLAVRPLPRPARAVVVVAASILALAVPIALAAPGYPARHAATWTSSGAKGWDVGHAVVIDWLARQPGYAETELPVAGVGHRLGMLVGSRLQHRVTFLPLDAPCEQIRRRARASWLLVYGGAPVERCLSARSPGLDAPPYFVYPPSGPVAARQPTPAAARMTSKAARLRSQPIRQLAGS